jgi:hypothetical protein
VGVISNGKFQHREAVFDGSLMFILFMGRVSGGDK